MTYIISEPCIDVKDRSCVDVCPVDCIHEVARMLVIDPEECIDCGACEPECPVEAITPEDAVPDRWTAFIPYQLRLPGRGGQWRSRSVAPIAQQRGLRPTVRRGRSPDRGPPPPGPRETRGAGLEQQWTSA